MTVILALSVPVLPINTEPAGWKTYLQFRRPKGYLRKTHLKLFQLTTIVTEMTPRKEAKIMGRPTYLSDKPCSRGHFSLRLTSNGHCVECYKQRISSRQEAKAAGYPTYQGQPCPHGHPGIRRTGNRHCVECDKQEKRDNVEYYMAYTKARVNSSSENQKKEKIRMKNYYIRNAAKIDARRRHRQAVNRNTLRLLYYDNR